MKVADELRPYLEQNGPNEVGEWGMFCPLHDDTRRSASVNFQSDVWYCHACERGGTVRELLRLIGAGAARTAPVNGSSKPARTPPNGRDALPSTATVAGWASALRADTARMTEMVSRRGLNAETLQNHDIGWDSSRKAYTIPVYDEAGELINVRRYQFDVPDDRRKIWSVAGHGSPALYPISELQDDSTSSIVLCEGEWDALLTIQNGYSAVTKTAAADVWHPEWNRWFKDKLVYICHDMDTKGQKANTKLAAELSTVASEVIVIELPYEVTEKHGKDLTDFWLEHDGEEFSALLDSESVDPVLPHFELDDIRVIDSLGSAQYGKPARLRVTVTGRSQETFMASKDVTFTCEKNAGEKCLVCPMNENRWNGYHEEHLDPNDPDMFLLVGESIDRVNEVLRKRIGAVKCGRMNIDQQSFYSVEQLLVRPDIDGDQSSYDPGSYQSRRIFSVGRHDTLPNSTVEIIGAIHPHPRDQVNAFLAHEVNNLATSLDKFEMNPKLFERLRDRFWADGSPLKKCAEISKDLSRNVTHIFGRPEMHVLMDLVWHSVLGFEFEGIMQRKGWLDVLILGDTRTGKSEAAARLAHHYRMGELVSCEAASYAGVVGGLEQYAGRDWIVKWGAIPLNDRRLVVLDEISGLHTHEIGQMSGIRSSGEAQLTKIQSERTFARTRLLWMGNPRGARMDQFTYGIQAIGPLIGNEEDIARFDLAMSVASSDVPSEAINRDHSEASPHNSYTSDLCHDLVLWAWSRKPHQVFWMYGAQDLIRQAAIELGNRYVDIPPLVQAASVRIKLARIAAALAARTFSTEDGEHLHITNAHVEDAVKFIDKLYGMTGFGYAEHSRQMLEEAEIAKQNIEPAKLFIHNWAGLARFLRIENKFRKQDLQDMLNAGPDGSSEIVNTLWNMRMIRKDAADYRVTPILNEILRELS